MEGSPALTGMSGMSGLCGGGGFVPPGYSPSLDYSDARNSQYYFYAFIW
jgi:hypothetical protein